MPEAPPPVRIANQSSVNSVTNAVPTAVAMVTTSQELLPVQVNEERGRGVNSEYICVDTPSEEEAGLGEQGGEELDISFDSQFPDLISDLITEESSPAIAPPPASSTPRPAVFPTGVRYVVPPQPSPSSSFLPFPHPLPSSTRLASITDFSPEWSYPEVTDQFGSEPAAGNCSECLTSSLQGGVKVLITGPWSEPSGHYSCVFDQSTVPASLIQPGVLRCYCPGTGPPEPSSL